MNKPKTFGGDHYHEEGATQYHNWPDRPVGSQIEKPIRGREAVVGEWAMRDLKPRPRM